MGNLEMNTRAFVLDALEEINKLRTFRTIDNPERPDLDEIAIHLEALSSELLRNDIKEVAENIKSALPRLVSLNERILNTYSELKAISTKIAKATEVVGVLIEIIAKATAAGII